MAENKLYLAVGEEATRGTKEASTVGFIPLSSGTIPEQEFNDVPRNEFRGDETKKGVFLTRRLGRSWAGDLEIPFFTEAGTTAGMVGTLLKHFFGYVNTVQNASTGQYIHMLSCPDDPLLSTNLGAKGLSLNFNRNKGAVMTNYPFVGGRVNQVVFEQAAGEPLKMTVSCQGQQLDTTTAEIGSPTFANENLRADFNNLSVYTGTITRTGTGPDYTDITFGSATQIKPDSITVTLTNNIEDKTILCGTDYPNKTNWGRIGVTVSITIDAEDPASGFSSEDEYDNRGVDPLTQNRALTLSWDTGTQAGTGDNHSLILDLPQCVLTAGTPEYDVEKDPMITLEYSGEYSSTTAYAAGLALKNTATTL